MYLTILNLKPNEFRDDLTVYEQLITMQHYGLPTRLLDITRNPLVAIFFACNNLLEKKKDGLIFVFNSEEDLINPNDKKIQCLCKIIESENPNPCVNCNIKNDCDFKNISRRRYIIDDNSTNNHKNNKKDFLTQSHIVRGIAKNQRINNQAGDFIFVGSGNDEKRSLDTEQMPDRYLIIDSSVKKVLLENLEVMNIHGGTIYPELSGMSSYLKNKILTS